MTVINELVYKGKDFVQKQDIAEQMNNHFCSLGSKLASDILDTASQPEDFLNRAHWNSYFRPVSVELACEQQTHFRSSLLSLRKIVSANPSGKTISVT